MPAENFVYSYGSGLYVNVTNRCTNRCIFCIRDHAAGVGGSDLWLSREPTSSEVIEAIERALAEARQSFTELVFCGFGEPLLRPDVVIETCRHIRRNHPGLPIRVNTNGLANLVHRPRDIAAELEGLVDVVSISLNGADSASYIAISRPAPKLAPEAFSAVLDFARRTKAQGAAVVLTVVTGLPDTEVDLDACRRIAADIGAALRVRPFQESFE